jgi:hypothetical protein
MNECPICYEELQKRIYCVTPCNHKICLDCIVKMKTSTCHICRNDISKLFPKEFEFMHTTTQNHNIHSNQNQNVFSEDDFPPLSR